MDINTAVTRAGYHSISICSFIVDFSTSTMDPDFSTSTTHPDFSTTIMDPDFSTSVFVFLGGKFSGKLQFLYAAKFAVKFV